MCLPFAFFTAIVGAFGTRKAVIEIVFTNGATEI